MKYRNPTQEQAKIMKHEHKSLLQTQKELATLSYFSVVLTAQEGGVPIHTVEHEFERQLDSFFYFCAITSAL